MRNFTKGLIGVAIGWGVILLLVAIFFIASKITNSTPEAIAVAIGVVTVTAIAFILGMIWEKG